MPGQYSPGGAGDSRARQKEDIPSEGSFSTLHHYLCCPPHSSAAPPNPSHSMPPTRKGPQPHPPILNRKLQANPAQCLHPFALFHPIVHWGVQKGQCMSVSLTGEQSGSGGELEPRGCGLVVVVVSTWVLYGYTHTHPCPSPSLLPTSTP